MKVTLIRVLLDIQSEWAVGAVGGGDDEIDLPLMTDPRRPGRAVVPPSSLIGSLRRHLKEPKAEIWLGPPPGDREVATGTRELRAGPLRALGVRVGDAVIAERRHTAIDGVRGAARPGASWSSAVATPTVAVLCLECSEADAAGLDVVTLLGDLASWPPDIGRGRGVGMGRAVVTSVESMAVDLATPTDLTWWLTARAAWLAEGGTGPDGREPGLQGGTSNRAAKPFRMVVREPIHVGTGAPVGPREAAPVVKRGSEAIIPGSSWKGVYRARVEAILAALGAGALGTDIVHDLFGQSRDERGQPGKGRGTVRFTSSTLGATDGETRTHVAIDRFTGGARDGALYSVKGVRVGTEFDLTIELPPDRPEVAALFDHVRRDLHDGLIGVGGNGSRGYGWVECADGRPSVRPISVDALVAELKLAAGTGEEDK